MTDTRIAILDDGGVNERILAKMQSRADFRRVEAASLKYTTHFTSPDGKRMFLRCFETFQLNSYFIATHGRMKLPHEIVETIETDIRGRIVAATDKLNKAFDASEEKFKTHGIRRAATYDTVPLEISVGILSSLGRRYFDLLHKLDQLMPLIQTLEIEEALTARDADHQRSEAKRMVIGIAGTARHLALGVRRRLDERDARDASTPAQRSSRPGPPTERTAGDSADECPAEDTTIGESGTPPEGQAGFEERAEV
jgi:hypothetical protein